jgi:hypothetical protein
MAAPAPAADQGRFGLGENGHAELTADGLGDAMLAFFDKLVRGLDEARIREFVGDVLAEARARRDPEGVKNLFVLAFQTRWCRGGKGERKICHQLLAVLYERYPEVVVELAELLPCYGYWKDLLSLLLECKRVNVDYSPLRSKVFSLFARQIKADAEELEAAAREGRTPKGLSLAAKFAPSEGGQHSRSFNADKEICRLLFPDLVGAHIADGDAAWPTARAKYRRLLSSVRRALALPEVLMCAQQWSEIEMSRVSSLAMARYKRAFLNEGRGRSEDPERAACRENLLTLLREKRGGVKGGALFPHQLVKEVLEPKSAWGMSEEEMLEAAIAASMGKHGALSEGVTAVLNAQWEAVRQGLLEQVEARKAELAQAAAPLERVEAVGAASQACPDVDALSVAAQALAADAVSTGASRPGGLSRVVCMADVSGSMSGTPMHVAIALGILVSEVCHPAFRDKVLTFSEDPQWHQLQPDAAFVAKVQSLQAAAWGQSTDFAKAMRKIAELVSAERLEQHDVPDLLVVSDMQFDEARGGYGGGGGEAPHAHRWNTAHAEIAQLFHQVGMQVHGRPLNPPNIIFWNVRADTVGYPAAADQKGVMLLSGYSPALMKFILSGEMEEEVATALDEDGNVVITRRQADPRETLRRVLNDSGLDAVRAVLDAVPSSKLPAQTWVPQ